MWTATAPAFYQVQAYHVVAQATCSNGPLQGRPTTRLIKQLPTKEGQDFDVDIQRALGFLLMV